MVNPIGDLEGIAATLTEAPLGRELGHLAHELAELCQLLGGVRRGTSELDREVVQTLK
jgi:hypothetical protein